MYTLEQSQLHNGLIAPTVFNAKTGTSLHPQSGSVGELQMKLITDEVEPHPLTAIIGEVQSKPHFIVHVHCALLGCDDRKRTNDKKMMYFFMIKELEI